MKSFALLFFIYVQIRIISIFCKIVENSESEDCKNVMNFFNKYEQQVGHKLKIPNCCDNSRHTHYINCENGYITAIDIRMSNFNEQIDFSEFPLLPNLRKLVFEGPLFKDGILPTRFFDIPKLEDLEIMSSNIRSIPNNINKKCPLKELNLYNNTIAGFPEQILNFKQLKFLDLSFNKEVETIPEGISRLENLETFYVGSTGLKSLHENIFNLQNLKKIDLDDNPQLNTRILNFGQILESCDFRDINVLCYQSGTCDKMIVEETPVRIYNYDVDNNFKLCTNVSKSKSAYHIENETTNDLYNNNNKLNLIIPSGIVTLGLIGVILIGYFVKFNRIKNNMKDDYDDENKYIEDNDADHTMNNKDKNNDNLFNDSILDDTSSFIEFKTSQLPLNNMMNMEESTSYISGFKVDSTISQQSGDNENNSYQEPSRSVTSISLSSPSYNITSLDENNNTNRDEFYFPYRTIDDLDENNSSISDSSDSKDLPSCISCIDNISQINITNNYSDFPVSSIIQPIQQSTYSINTNNLYISSNLNNMDSNTSIATINTNGLQNCYSYAQPLQNINIDFNCHDGIINSNNNKIIDIINNDNGNRILAPNSVISKVDTNFDILSLNSNDNNNNYLNNHTMSIIQPIEITKNTINNRNSNSNDSTLNNNNNNNNNNLYNYVSNTSQFETTTKININRNNNSNSSSSSSNRTNNNRDIINDNSNSNYGTENNINNNNNNNNFVKQFEKNTTDTNQHLTVDSKLVKENSRNFNISNTSLMEFLVSNAIIFNEYISESPTS